MKKLSKYIVFSIIVFLISVTNAFAVNMDLKTLGEMVTDKNSSSTSFYIIGKYVFTSDYVSKSSLNLQDIMLAARSIDLDGGDGELKSTAAYGKMTIQSASAIQDKTGKITGWTFGANLVGTNKLNDNIILDIKYIDYEAVKEVYTVTFKSDTDTEIEKQYVISGKKANPPKAEDRVGYDFKGWFKDNDQIDFSSKVITENLEVKQKYEIKKFTVTIDKDNGNEDSVTTQSVEYNKTASQPEEDPTKEGYDFKGWHKCLDDDCTKLEENNFNFGTNITEDTKIKAKWEAKKYTVTFDSDNGKSDAVKSVEVEYDKTVSELKPEPKKDGYKFLGWYQCTSTSDCENVTNENNKFNFETHIKDNIKLKAKWEQIIRHVTFKAIVDGEENNDFYQSGGTLDLTYPYQLTEENKPTLKTPDGYDLVEWRVNDKKIGIPGYYVTDDEVTVTGIWKIKQFEVSFDTDGGKTIGSALVNYGNTIPSPGEAVKTSNDNYNGYQFEGWYKCQDENCNSVDGEKFVFESTPIKENTKLKAKYTNKVYTNQVVAKFVDSLPTNNVSAYVDGDTKIIFTIKNKPGEVSLSNNFDMVVDLLNKALQVKNISNITINYNDNQNVVLTSISDVDNSMQDFFNKLTSKDYSSIQLKDLNGKKFKITVNLNEGFTDEENDNKDEYDVEFTSDFEIIHNENELKNNLTSGKELIIDKENWTGGISQPITIDNQTGKPIVIDGSKTTINSTISNSKYTFIIKSGEVVIKDLTLNIDILKPDEYDRAQMKAKDTYANKNTIGIKVEKDATLTVNNFHVKTKDEVKDYMVAGQVLNASTVPINQNAAIELYGTLYGSNVSYDSEIYGSPTILARKKGESEPDIVDAKMNIGKLNSQGTHYSVIRKDDGKKDDGDNLQHITKDFTNYYTNYNNSYLVFTWYNSEKSSIRPFTFLYGEKLILPKLFDVDGDDYNWIKNGENYQLTAWNIRHNGVTTHNHITSDALKEITVQDRETYYIYTLYSKVS